MSDFVENVSLKLETYQELVKKIDELEKELSLYSLFRDNILRKVETKMRGPVKPPIDIYEFGSKIINNDFSISCQFLQTPTGGVKVNIVIEMEVKD